MIQIIEAPQPRSTWKWQHHPPHPWYLIDLTQQKALKFHFGALELEHSKTSQWDIVPLANAKTRPIEYSSGEPYRISATFEIMHELEWPRNNYNTHDLEQDWSKIEGNAKKSSESILGQYRDLPPPVPNAPSPKQAISVQQFLIEIKKLHSNQLRLTVASLYFTDAYHIRSEDVEQMETGTYKAEGYNVVLTSHNISIKQRDEVFNMPTWATVKLEFLQR